MGSMYILQYFGHLPSFNKRGRRVGKVDGEKEEGREVEKETKGEMKRERTKERKRKEIGGKEGREKKDSL